MNGLTDKTGEILRRAGKRTAALQVFSVVLLVILIFLYVDIAERQRSVRDGVRENAVWAVFQLDREVRELNTEIRLAKAGFQGSKADMKAIALRYDIVFSRADLLGQGHFQDFFVRDEEIRRESSEIQTIVRSLDPLLTEINDAADIAARLDLAANAVEGLADRSNHLLLTVNTVVSDNRSRQRADLTRLQTMSGFYVMLLVLSVGFLIFTLRRQIKAVRQAGLGFETMANDLASAYNAADVGNRAKSQFMATMGHEIRTPLNAILGTAELLQLQGLPKDIGDGVQTIRSSGEALLEILNEILDYSKIEYGKLDVEMRALNVADFAGNAIEIMKGRARERGNALVLDMPETLERPFVKTDPTRLRQIVLNLMSNAVKFTENGTVTLRLREISGPNGTAYLRIEVRDTGIGIDDEGRKKLFKPFSQVDASISRRFGGTGLGLTISKEIAARLGGEIGVESAPGEGSTFWLQVRVERADAPAPVAQAPQPADLAPLPPLTVLVVEDNKVNQQIALRFLDRLGQKADLATDGHLAVAQANRQRYDLILMDMQMPEMDGIEAARIIRAGDGPNRTTPIVAMTANASDADRDACMEAGMDGFEPKPVTLPRLHAVLSRHATRPQSAAEPQAASELAGGLDPARKDELVAALGQDLFDDLVASFFDDAGVLLADYAEALSADRPAEADRALHTLKGAAGNVGFGVIAETAQSLRAQPIDPAGLARLRAMVAASRQQLAA